MHMSILPSPLKISNPKQNRLLAILPESESERLFSHMELVGLPIGEALYESGSRSNHVYFPTTAIVSLLHVMGNGASAEIAMVGNMGIVGVASFLGGDTILNRAVVRNAGQAYRLEAKLINEGIQSRRGVAALIAALHSGPDEPDGADCGLQSFSHRGSTTLSVAAAQSRPIA